MKRIATSLIILCLGFLVVAKGTPHRLNDTRAAKDDNGWTVIEMYEVNPFASGLAFDGEYFYIGGYGGGYSDELHRFDPETGELVLMFDNADVNQSFGLTYDGAHLWTIQQQGASVPALAVQIDMDGNILQDFTLPGNYMSGIAYDEGNFWVATYFPNPGTIHYVDDEGTVISEFTPPTNQPWDIALQDDMVWIVDFWNDEIHLMEADGTLVASFPYDDHRATGIYHDGTFLWYIGRTSMGVSTLYKVDPFGSGTPVIGVSPSFYFGNVTLGDTETWNMVIQNQGTGDLVIDEFSFSEGNTAFSVAADLPLTIEPGGSESVQVTFEPDVIALYDEMIFIHSNDVANPVTGVSLQGNGLAAGPYLVVGEELIDFGTVRIRSSSRLYLELMNMGDDPLIISEIDLSPAYYYFNWTVDFPITLDPVQSVELPFWFMPESPGTIDGEATVYFNNEEQSPFVAELTGVSDDAEYPIGSVLWDIELPGSSFDNPRAIRSIPDVTDDGVDDVLICTRGNRIMLYNGNSSGTPDLIWETTVGTVEYPKAVGVADDINGDGYQDIVIGTAYGDRAVTALSSRTGEMLWRFETNLWGGGGWVYMIDVKYDFNGNGYRDVLAAAGDDGDGFGPRRIFLLDGLTGELIWSTPMGGAAYSVLAVEDFTGDGIPDVIGGGSSANQGRVIAVNGANGSIVWDYTTAGTSVWALEQISDITGNGTPDLMAGSFNGFYYLMDITNGNVEYSGSLGGVLIIDFWQAGDLNDDGYIDIIPANSTSPNARAISGQNGQYIWSSPVQDQPWSVAVMKDINGDGINDVAVGTLFNNNFVNFLSGSDGEILHSFPMPDAVDAIAAISDITGSNAMEVVAASRNSYVVALAGGTALAGDEAEVSFTVTGSDNEAPLQNALIEVNGLELVTDENGQASVVLPNGQYDYTVTLDCYQQEEGQFSVTGMNLDVQVVLENIPGDANNDGVVNVLDVIAMTQYFIGVEPEVFCFNNADINQDGIINILDIISVVNIFSEGKANPFEELSSLDANMYLHSNGISLDSDGTLAGLQFDFYADQPGKLNMKLVLEKHEMIHKISGNKVSVMVFSIDNAPLPQGKTQIISFNDNAGVISWGDVMAGNLNADEVPVNTHKDEATSIQEAGIEGFRAYPNPASDRLWVEFVNVNESPVTVSLINTHGQVAASKRITEQSAVLVSFETGSLASGIYLLRLEGQKGYLNEKIIIE